MSETDLRPLAFDAAQFRQVALREVPATPDGRDSALRLTAMVVTGTVGLLLLTRPWWPATVAGVIILSVGCASIVSAQHECAHRALFRSRWKNDALGVAIGFLTFIPYTGYRLYHLHHHAHTHDQQDSEPVTVGSSVWMWLGTLVGAFHFVRAMSFLWLRDAFASRSRSTVASAAWSTAAALATVAVAAGAAVTVPRWFVLAWLVPILLGTVVNGFLSIPEHYGCGYGPDDAVHTTRTVTSNRLGRFIAWNANYHAEHHLAPTVPTAHLGRLHELLEPHLEFNEQSYFGYHRALLADTRRRRFPDGPPWAEPPLGSGP